MVVGVAVVNFFRVVQYIGGNPCSCVVPHPEHSHSRRRANPNSLSDSLLGRPGGGGWRGLKGGTGARTRVCPCRWASRNCSLPHLLKASSDEKQRDTVSLTQWQQR
eukprot:1323367-Amorphochlora_amoeboformis.AAC.2